jgi:hypothetical protein
MTPKETVQEISIKDLVSQLKKSLKEDQNLFDHLCEKYIQDKNREMVSHQIFMFMLDQKEIPQTWISKWQKLQSMEVIQTILSNMQDLSLDIPNLHPKLLQIMDSISSPQKEDWKKQIYDQMNSEDEESESEDDWEGVTRS